MYLARPTEDLEIDSILVLLMGDPVSGPVIELASYTIRTHSSREPIIKWIRPRERQRIASHGLHGVCRASTYSNWCVRSFAIYAYRRRKERSVVSD